MNINLNELNYKDKIEINNTFNYPEEYLEKSSIKKLNNVKVEGFIYLNDIDEYIAKLHIYGIMDILDSVTLEEIPYEYDILFDDVIPENNVNNQNLLDIMEFLWQNIVLEVPIRYTKSDADNLKGDNWQVISDNNNEEEIDPRMQKLYDYFNKGGE